ncbi:MAG TPA: phosphoribosyltransferase family protein [Burkholderiaceae bacterium]|nr:phosphoribosyltransferase family protein [Burkholderiaceae bacterium]
MALMFYDRADAGRQLVGELKALPLNAPVVVALPRGGVVVAAEVARALHAPLELVFVSKISAPQQPEFAIGAVVDVAPTELVIDQKIARMVGADDVYIEAALREGILKNTRRRAAYLTGREPVSLAARDVVVVDDGIATGCSMHAALAGLRRSRPARLVLAVPVAPRDVIERLAPLADEVVCLTFSDAGAVAMHYVDFHQLDDKEVVAILRAVDAANATEPPLVDRAR